MQGQVQWVPVKRESGSFSTSKKPRALQPHLCQYHDIRSVFDRLFLHFKQGNLRTLENERKPRTLFCSRGACLCRLDQELGSRVCRESGHSPMQIRSLSTTHQPTNVLDFLTLCDSEHPAAWTLQQQTDCAYAKNLCLGTRSSLPASCPQLAPPAPPPFQRCAAGLLCL